MNSVVMVWRFCLCATLFASVSLLSRAGETSGLLDRKPKWEFANPWVQSFQLNGRLHWQAAYVSGSDVNRRAFHDADDEYRRLRLGVRMGLLEYLDLEIATNLVSDHRKTGGELEWGYQDFETATVALDLHQLFSLGGVAGLKLRYGRHKLCLTEESWMSSNEIYTIERSTLSNAISRSARPTGLTLEFEQGSWFAVLGLFNAEAGAEFLDGWTQGEAWYGAVEYRLNEQWRLRGDGLVNSAEATGRDRFGYHWAGSLNAIWERGAGGVASTFAYGERHDAVNPTRGGGFYGLMVMPWYWLQADTLQAVAQYQWMAASRGEGLRLGSRYVRASEQAALNDGYGDALHTVYAGLNYHVRGQALKLMGGLEFTQLSTPAGTVRGLSYLMAVRMSF